MKRSLLSASIFVCLALSNFSSAASPSIPQSGASTSAPKYSLDEDRQSSWVSSLLIFAKSLFSPSASRTAAEGGSTDRITADAVDSRMPGELTIHGRFGAGESGSASGHYQITLHYNTVDNTVIGGHWTRIVQQADADGSTAEIGTQHGNIRGGSVKLNDLGGVTSLAAVELTITGGTGEYAQVTSGTGTFEGSFRSEEGAGAAPSPEPPPAQEPGEAPPAEPAQQTAQPAFSGTITLTF